jgi:hypothetical protein
MRSFLRTLFVFVALCLLINVILNSFNVTYLNPYFSEKVHYYQSADLKEKVNTLFFGSSRTYRHVQPHVFDSINNSSRSYNLGAAAAYVPESYYLCEEFLKDPEQSKNISTVFLELTPFQEVAYSNLFSRQTYYWLTLPYVRSLAEYFFLKRKSVSAKSVSLGKIATSFCLNKFGFNYILKKEQEDNKYHGPRKDGFYSLRSQAKYDKGLLKRFKAFRKASLQERYQDAQKVYLKRSYKNQKHYQIHIDLIKRLVDQFKSRNIAVYFVIPPRLSAPDYEEVLYIKTKMPELSVIDLGDPFRYPDFWKAVYSADIGHFNDRGAYLYSCALANRYKELVTSGK